MFSQTYREIIYQMKALDERNAMVKNKLKLEPPLFLKLPLLKDA